MNSSGDKLEKVKEAKTEDEVSPGTRMNLSSLTLKSVTEKFATTVSSSNQNTSGKMDINAIKNGDFSSIEGRWSTGNGVQDLVFSKNGLVEPAEFYVDINDAVFKDGYIITSYKAPTIRAQLDMIPAGVVISTVTDPNFV